MVEIVDFQPEHAPAFKALNVAWITRTSPIALDLMSSTSLAVCGWQRYMNASIISTSLVMAASVIAIACAKLKSEKAPDLLRALSASKDPGNRARAVFALGKYSPPGQELKTVGALKPFFSDPEDSVRDRALKSGAVGFLAKPFSAPDLIKCVEIAIHRGGAG